MDELHRVAQTLATRLGRAVAIDDPQMNLLAHTAHDEAVDEHRIASIMQLRAPEEVIVHVTAHGIMHAREPVRIPPLPEINLLARICVPVRCQDLLLGFLWLIDPDEKITAAELDAACEAAAMAGQVLFRERLLDDLRDSRERELLRDLLVDDPQVRAASAALLAEEGLLPGSNAMAVITVQVDEEHQERSRIALDAVLRRASGRATPLLGLALARGNGSGVLLLAGRRAPTEAQLHAVADEVYRDLLRALDAANGAHLGIGPVVEAATSAIASEAKAREAIAVARAVPGFGPVTAWTDLGVYRLLVQLPLDQLGADALPSGLRRLLATDTAGTLVHTLEVWLDEGGDPRATITRLQVHRTTLYYRIGRVEDITGMRLGNGGDRLALHLGLKLARLQGLLPPAAG